MLTLISCQWVQAVHGRGIRPHGTRPPDSRILDQIMALLHYPRSYTRHICWAYAADGVHHFLCSVIAATDTPLQLAAYPAMWFKKRRALATGLVIAGSSLGNDPWLRQLSHR